VSEFPQPSAAVKVRVMTRLQESPEETSTLVTVAVLQASVAVGFPRALTEVSDPQAMLTSPGGLEMTGAVLSDKVMIWTEVTAAVQPSVVLKVRVTVVSQEFPVVTSEEVTGKVPQESKEVGAPRSATVMELLHSRSMLAGVPERVGWTLSVTVMIWVRVRKFEQVSLTRKVLVKVLVQPVPVRTSE